MGISIAEFMAAMTALRDQHPMARVDFVYPKMRAGKKTSTLGDMTGYEVFTGVATQIIRIRIEHARTENHGMVADE